MGYFINSIEGYYEGDRKSKLDSEVTQRPTANHQWNGSGWEPVQRVPDSVFSWQLKRALTQQGIRQDVETAILSASQDLKDMWTSATEYHRNHAMILDIATTIGKSAADIDALFILADSIV